MDYFDKQDSNKAQERENYNHNQPQEPYHIAKNVFPDNWKVPQDGDFDFVSYQISLSVSLCLPLSLTVSPSLSLSPPLPTSLQELCSWQ